MQEQISRVFFVQPVRWSVEREGGLKRERKGCKEKEGGGELFTRVIVMYVRA